MDASARSVRVILSVVLAIAVAACSGAAASPSGSPSPSPSPSPAAAFPLNVTDDEGTAVEIPAEPARIVSLTPATTEILFAIGAGERVVATTDFDDYPPEAVPLPDVATHSSVDVEKIVGLEADLVLAGGNSFNDPDAIAQLRTLGTPVVVTYAANVEGVLRDIELIGSSVGEADAARDLVASMRAGFDQVAAATEELDKPRVFYELDATSDIYTATDDSFLQEMIELAGGEPITTGSTTNFAIPLERLIEADPQLILLGDAAYGVTAEQVKARSGWSVMTAVKDDRILPVDDIVITRPGPRLVEGLRQLAAAIHPEVALPSAVPAPAP